MTTPNKKPPREYLSLAGFAQRVGLSSGTLASYTRKGLLPPPDVIITDGQGGRQIRGWTPTTIDYWTTHRVGRGYRSDLRRPKNT
ncbi:transcriptional regulator [Actinomyces johnsonii]|uniref:Transcriptional regulator n=1 Tax=Actinomyces johnsonii TaxID=544581 RepID=A0A508A2V9_9ACTO|nr:transcriptional regulator [Actinomyces johnsonii]KAA8735192.1 transcriptional regulator [Actinomyces johnsonii]TQD41275.1 transcriptional regulator [Actinomyces johnsonii]